MHKYFNLRTLVITIGFSGCIFIFSFCQSPKKYNMYFDHLALSVSDVNQSATFYKDILKLSEIENRTGDPNIRWFSLGDGKELHLISAFPGNVVVTKAVHMALKTTEFDEFIRELKKHRIAYSDWPGNDGKIQIRPDGIRQIFFQDPDGYWIEVNEVSLPEE